MIFKGKFLMAAVLALLLASSLFIFLYLFKKPKVLEEKFVQEPFPSGLVSPTAITTPSIIEKPQEVPAITFVKPGDKTLLRQTRVSYQTFNNCGPATLSMILSHYGIYKSQEELGDLMRPFQHPKGDNDDKTIFPEEFVFWVKNYGLEALYLPGGTINLLKTFSANGVPVVVKTWLKVNEDIGHFRVVRGFDENKKVLITDDSYFGPGRKTGYFQFLEMWQPFNYAFLPVYPKEKKEVVLAVLGEDADPKVAYQKALERAKNEAKLDPLNIYPIFNQATSYYYLEDYEESIKAFKLVENRLPRRMLWYQIEPILAYQKLGKNTEALALIEKILTRGNRAFSELYQIRGEIYLSQGKKEAARAEFELALKYNKNFRPAKESLSRL